MCARCTKTESKSVINVATTPLTSHNLQALNNMDIGEEVKEHSVLHKRTYEEYEDYAQENIPEFITPQPYVKKVKAQ